MSNQGELLSKVDAAVDQVSVPLFLGSTVINYSIQVAFSSATSNGTLLLQVSNDKINWHDVTGSSQAVVAGLTHMWNVTNAGYEYVRATWDATSGAGTITVEYTYKENPTR